MITFIKSFFGRLPAPPKNLAAIQVHGGIRGIGLDVYQGVDEPGDFAITRYPPFDKGIPVVGVEKLLQSQQELIVRIFRTAGVSRDDFDKYYTPSIRNLARHVHLLPATSTTYFRGTGGLFRMNLEIALNALQSANAAVFPVSGGVERRFLIQPKWNLATFLAGLCSQNYRTVNAMAVLTRDNVQWTPLLDHLLDWCEKRKVDVYFVRWMEDLQIHGAQASAAYSISKVVPHDVLQYLANDNNQVVQAMTAAIAGVETNASENPISRLVAPVITRVIEDDLKRSATNYGHLVIGAHLEPHLVDAMRRLVRGGKWIANNTASGGRVWVGAEGVFIDWPVAAGDISNLLMRDAFAGIPKDPDTLADLLVSANLLELNNRGERYWTITLPGSFEAKDGMVKIKQGKVIFPQGFDFEPFKNVQLTLSASAPSGVQPLTSAVAAEPLCGINLDPSASKQAMPPTPIAKDVAEASVAVVEKSHKKHRNKPHSPIPEGRKRLTEEAAEPTAVGEGAAPAFGAEVSPTAERLLGSLKRSNAWLLNEVMHAYRNNRLTGTVASLSYGYAISHDELNIHGIPVMELLEELGLKAWLWQDKTRASRRIHQIEIDGKTHRMIVLKPDIAAGLGFDMETAQGQGHAA